MARKIEIKINEHKFVAELLDTKTADAIFKQLPFKSNQALEENAKDVVQLGELAFWVEGNCIAIGFGPTPISHDNEIRLAARTNIWAHTDYDLTTLKNVQVGDTITLNQA